MIYRRFFAEAIGVFLILFAVGVSNGEPFAVGGSLWCIMVLTGFTSNAVFNPAMCVSFILKAHLDKCLTRDFLIEYIVYAVIQFLSAILGALAAWGVLAHTVHFEILDGYSDAETFFGEVIYTSMIACNTHMMGKLSDNPIVRGGLVAMTVTGGIWAIGKISGACFNPAVGFAINLVTYIKTGKHMSDTWIYIFGPTVGAILGTFISQFFGDEIDNIRKAKEIPSEDEEITINLGG